MELQKALLERRSVRKFTDRPVDRALLEKLIKLSMWAPSGMNRQPWRFLVLHGESFDKLLRFSAGIGEHLEDQLKAHNFSDKMRAFIRGYFKDLGGARTAVVCLSRNTSEHMENYTNAVSCAAAMQSFLLLAHEAGLATCWMTGHVMLEQEFMRIFGVLDHSLVGVTPVGYADQTPPVPPRKHEDIVWME